jgi:bacterial/archaeal transporter family protein
MLWIYPAIGAYFILAFTNLLDKFLVDNVLKSSRVYAFFVSTLGLLAFILSPWFLTWPGFFWFLFLILIGALFSLALLFLFESLILGEASRVLLIIGGTTPIFSLIFSYIFFREIISSFQLLGFIFLIIGIFIIAFIPIKKNWWESFFVKFGFKSDKRAGGYLIAIMSGFFYSLYFVGAKQAFSHFDFFNVFLWTRLGAFFLVLTFLFNKKTRNYLQQIFKSKKKKKTSYLVFINQGLGSLGFVLQNYAISLGPVSIINAMQGFQYALILILGFIFSIFFPQVIKEDFSRSIVIRKVIAILVVAVGLYFISI